MAGTRPDFETAAVLLPPEIRARAMALPERERKLAEEFRLRRGSPAKVLLPEGEKSLGGAPVGTRELEALLERATGASVHTAETSLRQGFVTAPYGHRVGICGSAYCEGGKVLSIRHISSAAIRIAHEVKTAAEELLPLIMGDKLPEPTLIISPPGGGKTTLLRDLIRRVSDGGVRVALADERGEIAASVNGEAQLDVGACTDIMTGVDKAQAVMMMLRSMNPQIAAVDEITSPEDVNAMIRAANCGVVLIATIHAESVREFVSRPLCRELAEMRVFRRAAVIETTGGRRTYRVEEL